MGKGLIAFRTLQTPPTTAASTTARATSESSETDSVATSSGVSPASQPSTWQPSTIRVTYQQITFDWDLSDGTYTPEQMRKARLVVKPWREERHYTPAIRDGETRITGDLPAEFRR